MKQRAACLKQTIQAYMLASSYTMPDKIVMVLYQ